MYCIDPKLGRHEDERKRVISNRNTSVLPSGALTAVNVTFHGCHHLVIARVGPTA